MARQRRHLQNSVELPTILSILSYSSKLPHYIHLWQVGTYSGFIIIITIPFSTDAQSMSTHNFFREKTACKIMITIGGKESPEFQRQSTEILKVRKNLPCLYLGIYASCSLKTSILTYFIFCFFICRVPN